MLLSTPRASSLSRVRCSTCASSSSGYASLKPFFMRAIGVRSAVVNTTSSARFCRRLCRPCRATRLLRNAIVCVQEGCRDGCGAKGRVNGAAPSLSYSFRCGDKSSNGSKYGPSPRSGQGPLAQVGRQPSSILPPRSYRLALLST
ncbi:hypothetical protein L1887_57029 [Cichorium endivia]|nr:hypothetical protein L1887_57029 [Cichorium endivia]